MKWSPILHRVQNPAMCLNSAWLMYLIYHISIMIIPKRYMTKLVKKRYHYIRNCLVFDMTW